jgi:hypothetical protein
LSYRCARDCSGKPTGFALANPRTWSGKPGPGAKRGGGARKHEEERTCVFVLVLRKYLLTVFENRGRVLAMMTNRLFINLLSLLGLLPAVKAGKGTGV